MKTAIGLPPIAAILCSMQSCLLRLLVAVLLVLLVVLLVSGWLGSVRLLRCDLRTARRARRGLRRGERRGEHDGGSGGDELHHSMTPLNDNALRGAPASTRRDDSGCFNPQFRERVLAAVSQNYALASVTRNTSATVVRPFATLRIPSIRRVTIPRSTHIRRNSETLGFRAITSRSWSSTVRSS